MNDRRLLRRNTRRCPMFAIKEYKGHRIHYELREVRGIRTVRCFGKQNQEGHAAVAMAILSGLG